MNDYAPASSVGWLDFDATASERVSTLLRSFEDPATIDVLGLGTIRDAFAEMLTPGTSTIQTRLRYFIFLPWIFQRLEAEKVPPTEFARKLREAEAQLIDCLRHLGPGQGVIGRVAGRELKRMPSDIYWGNMAAWGIRRLELSLTEYGQLAAALEPAMSMWTAMPSPPERFLSRDITFTVTPEEAQVLTDGIRRHHPDTLIARLSESPGLPLDDIRYPWLVPTSGLPDRLVEVLRHGRCFSELTHGPRLVYNLLVARKALNELDWSAGDSIDNLVEQLNDWASLVESRHEDLLSWVDEPEQFRHLLKGHNIAARTLYFWDDMARRAVNDPTGFGRNRDVHRLIRERERRLKARRARLSHRSALETGGLPANPGQLDYRWSVTKQYLQDLA